MFKITFWSSGRAAKATKSQPSPFPPKIVRPLNGLTKTPTSINTIFFSPLSNCEAQLKKKTFGICIEFNFFFSEKKKITYTQNKASPSTTFTLENSSDERVAIFFLLLLSKKKVLIVRSYYLAGPLYLLYCQRA